jgi:hypothetical protein
MAKEGLGMIGIAADHRWAYATPNGSAGFPAVNPSTCRAVSRKQFMFNGKNFNAKLVYTDNNFEAFFTVSDPQIKAYTVYPPQGPFQNQQYYYLQVLSSVAAGTQFWVWDGDQTNGGVTVSDWVKVPGQGNVPVPPIPP